MSNGGDPSVAWVAEEARGLRLRREGLEWHAWHPRHPWIALTYAAPDGEGGEWWSVVDVVAARVLVEQRVDGETGGLEWVGDDVLARVHHGPSAVRVDLHAVPDGGVVASGALPFRPEGHVSVVWLPAAKRLVAWGDVADDRVHGSSVLCALDPELRLLHTVDVGALPSARPGGHFDAVALDPDGRFVALWFARLRWESPSRNAHAAIVSWSGATPVRQVAVEGMRGRPESFGDEFGSPFVHGARWASADRVEFYAERDTARVDPRDGRWVVTEDDHFFGREEVYCRELADAPEARVTLCIATDRWGLMTPLVYWGLRFDEGAARVGCLLPWPRAVGWCDEEVEVQNHAAHAAGRVALLTGVQGSPDALTVRLVDLRAGRAGMRAAEVATVAGRCGSIELSPDARWVFVTTHGRAGAEECRVFPTGDLAWAPMRP